MCQIVVINRGEKEITTPRQFKEHFGFDVSKNVKEQDECLCPFSISTVLKRHKIDFKTYCGDVYVGRLELIKGDNDK